MSTQIEQFCGQIKWSGIMTGLRMVTLLISTSWRVVVTAYRDSCLKQQVVVYVLCQTLDIVVHAWATTCTHIATVYVATNIEVLHSVRRTKSGAGTYRAVSFAVAPVRAPTRTFACTHNLTRAQPQPQPRPQPQPQPQPHAQPQPQPQPQTHT